MTNINFHRLLYIVFYLWCGIVNWVWVGHLEQGLTQTQLQPGAALSASTSYESEEQVCKD